MIDYSAILATNYADQQWTLNGDTYDGLVWLSDTPKPTQAELDAQWPAVDYQNQYNAVSQTRHVDYIKTSDPIFLSGNVEPKRRPIGITQYKR